MCKRPMTHPERMAIAKPEPRYNAATFHPNNPNSKTSATSFTMGAEMRKEKVTPKGTPVVTNPINRGTAEQEQKGVTIPSKAARTLPTDSLRPAKTRRVLSGVKKERTIPTKKTTRVSNISTFGTSYTKKAMADASRVPCVRARSR